MCSNFDFVIYLSIGPQSKPCWCGNSDNRKFCATDPLYCHKNSGTCRDSTICAPAKYFQATNGACTDMTVKTCPVKEEYSSPSSVTDFFVGSTADDAVCTKCPPGQIQPFSSTDVDANGGSNVYKCFQCARGFFETADRMKCVECAVGRHSNTKGAVKCDDCVAGSYSNAIASTSCTTCGSGQYTNMTGSTACLNCPKGRYLSDASNDKNEKDELKDCKWCPILKYNPFTGQSACSACPNAKKEGAIVCVG